jgi:hypothetical protein
LTAIRFPASPRHLLWLVIQIIPDRNPHRVHTQPPKPTPYAISRMQIAEARSTGPDFAVAALGRYLIP